MFLFYGYLGYSENLSSVIYVIPHLQTENTSFFFHVRKREGFEGAAAPFDALGSQALHVWGCGKLS